MSGYLHELAVGCILIGSAGVCFVVGFTFLGLAWSDMRRMRRKR